MLKPALLVAGLAALLLLPQVEGYRYWPLRTIDDLTSDERVMVDWIKRYTAPNTRQKDGSPWTAAKLPSLVRTQEHAKLNLKPQAWAAAIVTSWSIHEGIFHEKDFINHVQGGSSTMCSCLATSPQIRGDSSFPTWLFSYNLCKGNGWGPKSTDKKCACTQGHGQLIGPNQMCQESCGSCWQSGIFGVEMSLVPSAADIAARAHNILVGIGRSANTYIDAIEGVLSTAGYPPTTALYKTVMACFPSRSTPVTSLSMTCADLTRLWLSRHHLVALTYVIEDNLGDYAGSDWQKSIVTLAKYFN